MNAADEIQAAIEKLTGIKRGLGEKWRLVGELVIEHDHPDGEVYEVLSSDYEGIPAAVVTLHATIDAQLAILKVAEPRAHMKIHLGGKESAVWANERLALTLARAINGATS